MGRHFSYKSRCKNSTYHCLHVYNDNFGLSDILACMAVETWSVGSKELSRPPLISYATNPLNGLYNLVFFCTLKQIRQNRTHLPTYALRFTGFFIHIDMNEMALSARNIAIL